MPDNRADLPKLKAVVIAALFSQTLMIAACGTPLLHYSNFEQCSDLRAPLWSAAVCSAFVGIVAIPFMSATDSHSNAYLRLMVVAFSSVLVSTSITGYPRPLFGLSVVAAPITGCASAWLLTGIPPWRLHWKEVMICLSCGIVLFLLLTVLLHILRLTYPESPDIRSLFVQEMGERYFSFNILWNGSMLLLWRYFNAFGYCRSGTKRR